MRSSIRTFEMVETSRVRARIADLIEALVDLLDSVEPDPDFEPDNDDEPSLGWCDSRSPAGFGSTDDGEFNGDELDDNGDCEPFLGWVTREHGGTYCGSSSDFEE
ncbi:hypothetical protein [Xanthobacter variabilis]|uniref:hypothetical protein n=1 Tax=Xanthobacter variabilis TaxID=3119932 RepID=UPI00372B78B9